MGRYGYARRARDLATIDSQHDAGVRPVHAALFAGPKELTCCSVKGCPNGADLGFEPLCTEHEKGGSK